MTIIDQSISPYYDDFNPDAGFHQVLFKPGYAVQARELTQLQSITRDQISKFGNHVFKQGSIVIPGNSFTDLNTPYVKLNSSFNSVNITGSSFVGSIIVGVTNGLRAVVKLSQELTETDPITLYVSYLTGGGEASTSSVFLPGEELYLEDNTSARCTVFGTAPTGYGSLAFVNKGVYFVNNSFVTVLSQSIVISKYTSTPSCHVLLRVTESIVNATDDGTLLDPAQGSYNYAAPGADRVKIVLTLVSLPLNSTIDDNYVEIMRYNAGVLEEHARFSTYSELEKNLARRTHDESGNYLVKGFKSSIRDHLKTTYNNGMYTDGDIGKFVVEVQAGKGYIEGLEVDVISKKRINIDKARSGTHIKDTKSTVQADYGKCLYVSDLKNLPNFTERQTVDLFNASKDNVSGTKIGELKVVGIDYHTGDPSSSEAVYRLYIDDLVLNTGSSITDVGSIQFSTGSATVLIKYTVPSASFDFVPGAILSNNRATRSGTVHRYVRTTGELYIYKHSHTLSIPVLGEFVKDDSVNAPSGTITALESSSGGGKLPLIPIPNSSIKSIKTIGTSVYDIRYTSWKRVTIVTNSSGYGDVTVTDGIIVSPESGSTIAVDSNGIVTNDKISVENNNKLIITGGPVSTLVTILTQVTKENKSPKIKTLTTGTLPVPTPTDVISLGKADIYRIVSITQSGLDITDRYSLDNGQRDYYYGIGKLNLVKSLPTSEIIITFEYFAHTGVSDYFSIDSYETLGADYISKIPKYVSKSTYKTYDLSSQLDFRPTMGPSGVFSAGGSLIDIPTVDSFVTTSVQYYVSRIDILFLNKDKSIGLASGVPNIVPARPVTPTDCIELAILFIPAYTYSVSDIMMRSLGNYRYTMDDIRKLEHRIENVEYFSTLNSLESSLISYDIVDAESGLTAFKTGYLVDNFENVFSVCDFFNTENRSSFFKRSLSTAVEDHEGVISLLNTSTDYKLTGTQLSLPYTETPLISQLTSTRVTNLNPFMVFSWEGVMTITPPADTWIETQNLPTLYNSVEETIFVNVPVTAPAPTPVPAPTIDRIVVEQVPEPTPTPIATPVIPTERAITVFARDLGLIYSDDINAPSWSEMVTFTVPQSVYDQTIADISQMEATDFSVNTWANTASWQTSINAINTAFNSAIDIVSAPAGDTIAARVGTASIINYWTGLIA